MYLRPSFFAGLSGKTGDPEKFKLVTQLTPEQYAQYQASGVPATAEGVKQWAQANNIQLTSTNTNTNTAQGGAANVTIGSNVTSSIDPKTIALIVGGVVAVAAVAFALTRPRSQNPVTRLVRRVVR